MAKLIGMCKDMPYHAYPDRPADWDTFMQEQEDALEKLNKVSDHALSTGNPVGFILSFQVADGYALYRVAKVKPLELELIPYSDAYQIPVAHVRGITVKDVMIAMQRKTAMDKIFGKEVV